MRPSSCGFFLVLPRSLAAPVSRHKAPQHGLWLLFCHPIGTLKSRGLWSRGQQRPQKTRRDTFDGFAGVFLVTCFVETKSHLQLTLSIVQRVLGNPGGAIPRCHLAPYHAESILTVAVACPQRRRFKDVNVPWSCRPSCSKIGTPLTRGLLL